MLKLLLIMSILVLVAGPAVEYGSKYIDATKLTRVESQNTVMDLEIPKLTKLTQPKKLKVKFAKKTITLERSNTLVLRGPITAASVATFQQKLLKMSFKLNSGDVIYVVLDTPGGSVFAGMDLIDHLHAIPQQIITITLFSASMGFQVAQNSDVRYITPSGTLMSHRAHVSGLSGQFDGELESQYVMLKQKIDYLDAIAAKRMKLSLKAYKTLIKDEYWVHGFNSVDEKAADEMVNVNCGKSLFKTQIETVNTLFGKIDLVFSKCPLIRTPLKVSFKNVDKKNVIDVKRIINMIFHDKKQYVKDFILTNDHFKYFKK